MSFNGFYQLQLGPEPAGGERFAYVGCVHGSDDKFSQQLADLAEQNLPDHLIFMGDLTGSPEMEELKRRFYNLVQNRSKPLLHQNPKISDGDLLGFSEPHPPEEALTLRDGYRALYQYQLVLEGFPQAAIEGKLAAISDAEIAESIRQISQLRYYGNYVSELSAEVRMGVLLTLESSAKQILSSLDSFLMQGTEIAMVGGNWDYKYSGVKEITGRDLVAFNTMDYFQSNGIQCIEQLDVLETENTFHILAAYDGLLELDTIPEERLRKIAERVQRARAKGKAIIVIGHGEPNWKIHTLHIPTPPPNPPDRDIILRNFGKLIARFKPDQVAYPHQHNRILNEMREEVGLNVKYVLESAEDGEGVNLIEESDRIGVGENQTVATYVPFRHIARGTFSRKIEQKVFDGSQMPITVQ